MTRLLAIGLALGVLSVPAGGRAGGDHFGPWSISEQAPVVQEGDDAASQHEASGTSMSLPVLGAMRFYSAVISEADGDRCDMYPTCAGYAVDAVRKHGPILGGIMAADRLIHESGAGPGWYQMTRKYEKARWLDPVEQNDFWFARDEDDE